MITQHQIGRNRLFAIIHHPAANVKNQCILMISGVSLPMCDIDYFMSRFARHLCRQGFHVMQMDIRGHGDSYGNLEDVTIDTIREDMSEGINFLRDSQLGNVYIVSRGLNAALSAEFAEGGKVNGVAGIGPYCLLGSSVQQLWSGLISKNYYTGIELVPGNDYRTLTDFDKDKLAFFSALGARLRNILGQVISARFLNEIWQYDPCDMLNLTKNKTYWLFHSMETDTQISEWTFNPENPYISLNEYNLQSFLRNPIWQFNIMKAIEAWLLRSDV